MHDRSIFIQSIGCTIRDTGAKQGGHIRSHATASHLPDIDHHTSMHDTIQFDGKRLPTIRSDVVLHRSGSWSLDKKNNDVFHKIPM